MVTTGAGVHVGNRTAVLDCIAIKFTEQSLVTDEMQAARRVDPIKVIRELLVATKRVPVSCWLLEIATHEALVHAQVDVSLPANRKSALQGKEEEGDTPP